MPFDEHDYLDYNEVLKELEEEEIDEQIEFCKNVKNKHRRKQ